MASPSRARPDSGTSDLAGGTPSEREAPRHSAQRVTLPALRQPVQTLSRLGAPLTVARTRWMFGSNRRFVILRDHGRLFPNPGPLAQMSQTAATVKLPQDRDRKGSGDDRTTATG